MIDIQAYNEGKEVAKAFIAETIVDFNNPYPPETLQGKSWDQGLNETFDKNV